MHISAELQDAITNAQIRASLYRLQDPPAPRSDEPCRCPEHVLDCVCRPEVIALADYSTIPQGLPNGLGLMLWPLDWPRPLELTTGHDDADGDCHELEDCSLVDLWPWPGTPPCTCRYWSPGAGSLWGSGFRINPSCLHHGDGYRW